MLTDSTHKKRGRKLKKNHKDYDTKKELQINIMPSFYQSLHTYEI